MTSRRTSRNQRFEPLSRSDLVAARDERDTTRRRANELRAAQRDGELVDPAELSRATEAARAAQSYFTHARQAERNRKGTATSAPAAAAAS